MANTVIQLKYSNVTGTPPSLNLAEPAYSNVSNKLWIDDGSGVVAIGGKYYTQLIDAATSNATQNTIVRRDTSGNFSANAVTVTSLTSSGIVYQNGINLGDKANAAFDQANTALEQGGVIAGGYANSAFTQANTATQYATSAGDYANSAYIQANSAYVSQNTTGVYANASYAAANVADQRAVTSGDYANSAYALANTKFASAGGTISGDVVVSGNLTISGNTTYVDTLTVNISDNIITLNADIPQDLTPSENAGIEIDRGLSDNVALIWNESTDKWTFTNDGTNYSDIGSAASESYANSAYDQANTGTQYAQSAGDYANSAYTHANSSYGQANTGTTLAQAAFDAANSSLGGTATDGWARDTANAASSYANSAYVQANTATQYATSAGVYANAAFDLANTDVTTIITSTGSYGSATVVPTFNLEANGRISSITTTTISLGASAITSGTLGVERGGTGNTSFTSNHVIIGNGTGGLTTTGSSTEGHLLTINASGVPTFQYLNGGTF
jgi:hypothetical protein